MKTTLIPYSAISGVYFTSIDIYNHNDTKTIVNVSIQSNGKIIKEVIKEIEAYHSDTFPMSNITNARKFQTIVTHDVNVFITSFLIDKKGGITFQTSYELE